MELMQAISCQKRSKARLSGTTRAPSSETLAVLLDSQFGSIAPTVAAWCALIAWDEGQEDCYRTWARAFRQLAVAGPPFPQPDDGANDESL